MPLSDFAAIGSFVSGIAVLISLVYLSLQARQNAASFLRAENNATQSQNSAFRLAIVESRDVAQLWLAGLKDGSTLPCAYWVRGGRFSDLPRRGDLGFHQRKLVGSGEVDHSGIAGAEGDKKTPSISTGSSRHWVSLAWLLLEAGRNRREGRRQARTDRGHRADDDNGD